MTHSFLERLQRGPILCDGAMGTMLYARGGIPYDRSFDELNVLQPGLVQSIHLDYIRAGAEIIETNTFGANRFRLAQHDLADRVRDFNIEGARIARQAVEKSGQPVFVAGSVGPLGKPLAPFGSLTPAEARAAFSEQIQALVEGGVDLLILETFADLREMCEAIKAARATTDLPIIAQMTFGEEGMTPRGDTAADIVKTLDELGVDVIGANCSVGSQPMLAVMEQMVSLTHTPLSAQPNAGFPAYVDGRFVYLSSPEYMASHARRMVELGVTIVGGCCGTTPDHITAIHEAIQDLRPADLRRPRPTVTVVEPERPVFPLPVFSEPTLLAQKLGKQFVVTVEVDPPRGFDLNKSLPVLQRLKETGVVDAIDVADAPRAQARMSALAMCALIQNRLGIETIFHLATRHRNLVALHSELLGAHALGVRNIFVVMGDLPHTGDYPDATAVSDVTASGLMRLIKCFNEGIDLTGKAIEQPTSFFVGCALNMGAENLDKELKILDRKVAAGADFILTQPIYDPEVLERCWKQLGGFPRPVLMGVLPLWNYRHAEFLHNEVPGIIIPAEVRERLRQAGEHGREVGITLAQELLRAVKGQIAGAYFMPPFGHYEIVAEVIKGMTNNQ